MNNISVSIIVPIYNVEKYLAKCLNSLERQTFDDIEIIMVNDGSTDNSGDIAKTYANKNENFCLINRENGGLSAARNSGLDVAKGEYVYFLDSDDFLADDAIEKLYKKAKAEDLDQLRFVAYTFEDGTKNYLWTRDRSEGGYKYLGDYSGVFKGMDFYQKTLDNNDYYPSCCLIFTKRTVIEENHLRFYEGILHEDILFNFQLTTLSERVALLNEPLYYRRFRTGSITQDTNWMKRNRSMCISAVEADKFVNAHPQIQGKTADWQINFFLNMMLRQWEQMTRGEQESRESNEYFERVKPLVKKYGGGKSLLLFYASHSLYRTYLWLRHTAGKVLHRG